VRLSVWLGQLGEAPEAPSCMGCCVPRQGAEQRQMDAQNARSAETLTLVARPNNLW